ncbi:hypothetical protein KUCAC02_035110 [Xyrichtys novacula]|uniref:Uncharacterized protein n=1 Tax=Xyrichtys novacula TaxID=13765 RepID=A0AAV1FAV0_XYRNO|nr:hypothetical protein KUCAC02_035110 [Xyrichtys novacula]
MKCSQRNHPITKATTVAQQGMTPWKTQESELGATEAWIGHCLMTSDDVRESKAKKFKELLERSWSDYVSANAHSTIEQRKWNNEDSVPLTKDIVTLQNYLRTIEDQAKAELMERDPTPTQPRAQCQFKTEGPQLPKGHVVKHKERCQLRDVMSPSLKLPLQSLSGEQEKSRSAASLILKKRQKCAAKRRADDGVKRDIGGLEKNHPRRNQSLQLNYSMKMSVRMNVAEVAMLPRSIQSPN